VFDASTRRATTVFCQQRHFWSVDPDDASAVALAVDLNRCARW